MATRKWLGTAKNVAQLDTVTAAGVWAANDTITLTIANIDFVVTIGSLTSTSQIATTLYQAFMGVSLSDTTASCSPTIAQGGAQAIPQFAEITASVPSGATSTVQFVGDTAGKPFTMTAAENTAGTGTASLANTTAATGKWSFDNADNWSGNAVPVDADTIVFDSGSIDCLYGLTPAIQPTTFIKYKTYTGDIGLAETNTDDTAKPYAEYRTKYLVFDDNGGATTTYHIEQGSGSGSSLVRINAGAGAVIWNSYGSGSRFITGQPCALFLGTNAANVFNVAQGDLGIAFFPDESSTAVALRVGDGTTSGATVVCGSGVTLTSAIIDIAGGSLTLNSATTSSADTDISGGGSLYCYGTGGHISIDVRDGTCYYRTSGTLATLAIQSAGTFDVAGDLRGATITNVVNMYSGSNFNDPHGVLTLSAGFKLNGCVLEDVTIDNGVNRTYTIA